MKKGRFRGSSFDDYLRSKGILEEVEKEAWEEVKKWVEENEGRAPEGTGEERADA